MYGGRTMAFFTTHFTTENLIGLGISIGILLFAFLFRKVFTKAMYNVFSQINKKSRTELSMKVFLSFEKPVNWLFIVIGLYVAAKYFPFMEQKNILFLHLIRSSIIILITWGLYNLSSSTSLIFANMNEHSKFKIDDILIPFLSKAIRFIIIAISISIIALEFEYDVSGFVAGLGIGGLAFALAAKDALANLFGGVVIISEKPFTIGDWILTPSVEGTVEDITFRSTKIRTFAQALVTVPNATLANEAITNWSKMGKRQISFDLRLTFDTPIDHVKSMVEQMEDYLINNPDVHQETIFVKFDEYKENGLDILFYFFTKTTNWGDYLDVKQEINFKIMEMLEEADVSIAIPSRRVYAQPVENNNEPIKQEKMK